MYGVFLCNSWVKLLSFYHGLSDMQEKSSICLSGKLYYFVVLSNITVSACYCLIISSTVWDYTYFQWTEDGQGFQMQYLILDT